MSDQDETEGLPAPDGGAVEPPTQAGVDTVEAYEVEDGVVFYDAENPLAWVRASNAVTVRE